jgi:hypothetical protein
MKVRQSLNWTPGAVKYNINYYFLLEMINVFCWERSVIEWLTVQMIHF